MSAEYEQTRFKLKFCDCVCRVWTNSLAFSSICQSDN